MRLRNTGATTQRAHTGPRVRTRGGTRTGTSDRVNSWYLRPKPRSCERRPSGDEVDQAKHDRWFAALLGQLRRHGDRRSAEWHRLLAELPRLERRDPLELREILRDAEPATVDDVPWTFPVRTPLEPPN